MTTIRALMLRYVDNHVNGHQTKTVEARMLEVAKVGAEIHGGYGKGQDAEIAKLEPINAALAFKRANGPFEFKLYCRVLMAMIGGATLGEACKEVGESTRWVERREERATRQMWAAKKGDSAHPAA